MKEQKLITELAEKLSSELDKLAGKVTLDELSQLKSLVTRLSNVTQSVADELTFVTRDFDDLQQELDHVYKNGIDSESEYMADVYERQLMLIEKSFDYFQASHHQYNWLNTPNPRLDDKSPIDMCDTSEGYDIVMKLFEEVDKAQSNK